jgi:coenzyme F420 hydrogenase subunit beta
VRALRRPPLTLEQIVRGGLCIGCGLCESVAGRERVSMAMTETGVERPIVRSEPLDRATLARINAVCPGTTIRGGEADGAEVDPVWGPVRRVVAGHSADPDERHAAATGGVLSALGRHLVDSGRVDRVLHVAASPERPMRSRPHVSRDGAAVRRGTGSRYGPAAPLVEIRAAVDAGRPFAVIGKPCDVTAARNLARIDPRARSLMRYALALVCGGASALGKSQEVLQRFGVDERELTTFRYRGFGCPGLTTVRTADGREHTLTYGEMWDDEGGWQLQSRCKICPDAIGEAADLVAGDMFPGGAPPDTGVSEVNAIIVRTAAGAELLDAAVAARAVTLGDEIPVRALDGYQPHQVAKKRAVAARLAGVALAGGPVPRVHGLRIGALAARGDPRANLHELGGAYRRARVGRIGEPAPVPETGD